MEERYGVNQVCSVGTYSSLQLRAALKDMSRLYSLEFQEVNEMMKLFDVKDRKPEDLFKIACANSRVKNFVKANPSLINEALLLMPAPKAQSVHACAMMIFPDDHDMFHWVPIRKSGGEYVTEWEGSEMDSAGFLKEDILGVKQFDKFQDMVSLIKEHEGVDLDIFKVPLNDQEVYRYFQNGWNEDNFHFGSGGLTGYCKQMKPENIEDLIAAISLYRPGAMENNFHNDYILRKSGEKPVEYWVGSEQALGKSYGLIIFQESVMELCRTLGGLSLVEADDVRKAMVKKKYEALQQYKERFIPNYCEQFGVTQKYSEDVWDAIDKASLYLFNRCIWGGERINLQLHEEVGFYPTVAEMYRIKHDKEWASSLGHIQLHLEYSKIGYGISLSLGEDGRLTKNKIKEIYYQGRREVFVMKLESGKCIATTDNHKFPTSNGIKLLKEINIDTDKIHVNEDDLFSPFESIVSIESMGVDDVYDVEMYDPYHTFTTLNGIVTCNSHAAAYALTGYISQWVKVHYPIEYWSVAFKYATEDDYPRYISEINKTGVCTVRPVDINLSQSGVYINFKERALYWSIMGVKQVAEKATTQILLERDTNGRYYSLEDFITRHKWKGSAVDSRVVKNLIFAGAFDSIENICDKNERAELICQYQESRGGKIKDDDPMYNMLDHLHDDWWWTLTQKHLSGLAFFNFEKLYDTYANSGIFCDVYEYATFEECHSDTPLNNGLVIVAGCVVSCDIKKTKRGDSMCRIVLENNYEFLDVVLFKNEFEMLGSLLSGCKNNLLMISGSLTWDKRSEKNTLRANRETNIVTLALK